MGQQRPFTALKYEEMSLVGETKVAKLAVETEIKKEDNNNRKRS